MLKIKIFSVATAFLGIISFFWLVYDYFVITNALYKKEFLIGEEWKYINFGFIPMILFHFCAFITVYFILTYLKGLKEEKKSEISNNSDSKET